MNVGSGEVVTAPPIFFKRFFSFCFFWWSNEKAKGKKSWRREKGKSWRENTETINDEKKFLAGLQLVLVALGHGVLPRPPTSPPVPYRAGRRRQWVAADL